MKNISDNGDAIAFRENSPPTIIQMYMKSAFCIMQKMK